MIEKIWSGFLQLYIILLPFSWLYGFVSICRRWLYRVGWLHSWRAPIPVVIVGNISVGGNGKTPLVIWLVNKLKQRGISVGVVSRGYRGKAKRYPLILDGSTLPVHAGDEAVIIFEHTAVPVVVDPDRCAAIKALLMQSCSTQLVISDDGLQHYSLQRDLEIAVVDGVRRFGNGWWLPAGPMRERSSRLRDVDAVIINSGSVQGNEISMNLQASRLVNMVTGNFCDPAELGSVIAMAGIGHPERFFKTLETLGIVVISKVIFADHQYYTADQLNSLASPHQILVMTEKDAVKCRQFSQSNWWYLPVEVVFSKYAEEYLIAKCLGLLANC